MPNALTVNQAAARLSLSTSTVYRMLERGELPARKIGRQWRFDAETLDLYLKNQQPPAVTTAP